MSTAETKVKKPSKNEGLIDLHVHIDRDLRNRMRAFKVIWKRVIEEAIEAKLALLEAGN